MWSFNSWFPWHWMLCPLSVFSPLGSLLKTLNTENLPYKKHHNLNIRRQAVYFHFRQRYKTVLCMSTNWCILMCTSSLKIHQFAVSVFIPSQFTYDLTHSFPLNIIPSCYLRCLCCTFQNLCYPDYLSRPYRFYSKTFRAAKCNIRINECCKNEVWIYNSCRCAF